MNTGVTVPETFEMEAPKPTCRSPLAVDVCASRGDVAPTAASSTVIRNSFMLAPQQRYSLAAGAPPGVPSAAAALGWRPPPRTDADAPPSAPHGRRRWRYSLAAGAPPGVPSAAAALGWRPR